MISDDQRGVTPAVTPGWPALLAALHQAGAAGYYWRKGSGSNWWAGEAGSPPAAEDVYFGVHPARARLTRGRRARPTDLAAVNCLYAEFDAKDFAGGKAEALAHIEALPLLPSVIVDSGGGYHCYWLLGEPYRLDDVAAHAYAADVQFRWVPFVGADLAARDLVRVLRVPGTLNTKYMPARPVELLRCDLGARYNLAALAALLPAVEAPAPRSARPAAPVAARRGESPITAFNAATPIADLLERYGSTRAPGGWSLNDGIPHENAIQGNITKSGLFVFYTTRSPWAPSRTDRHGRPIADSFDLYTQVEHGGDKRAAVAALCAQQPRLAPNYPPHPAEAGERLHSPAEVAEARRRDAERKRQARAAEAAATLQDVRDRAAVDPVLARRPAEAAVLRALLDIAGERDWCRPSKPRIAEVSCVSLGTVKRALMELEDRGYFRSEGDGGGPKDTALRTFLRGSPSPNAEAPATDVSTGIRVIPECIEHVISESIPVAGEGGRAVPMGEQDDLDDAGWAALLASAQPPADDLADPAAVAAWPVEGGLCEVPATLLLTVEKPAREQTPEREVTPSGPISFAGGASFDPTAATPSGQAQYTGRPKDSLGDAECYKALCAWWVEAAAAIPTPPPPDDAVQIVDLVKGPPRNAERRRAYHALLGRARKAASAKQRRWLEGEAQTLEEWYTPAELAQAREQPASGSRQGARARPPSPAPGAVQVDLFGYLATTLNLPAPS